MMTPKDAKKLGLRGTTEYWNLTTRVDSALCRFMATHTPSTPPTIFDAITLEVEREYVPLLEADYGFHWKVWTGSRQENAPSPKVYIALGDGTKMLQCNQLDDKGLVCNRVSLFTGHHDASSNLYLYRCTGKHDTLREANEALLSPMLKTEAP